MALDEWEVVVGLECHVQLKTRTKLFSPAPVRYGSDPNADVDVVDVGLPGTLPVLNAHAVECAIRLGLALGATVREHSVFARKHYFYPDLPKGYQISQYEEPVVSGGALDGVRITRAHLEEDAGKSVHDHDDGDSGLDYNRAGTALLEVVTEPDLRSGKEAEAFFRALRALVMALDVCDGNLQEGSMRADANVSVRKRGDAKLGQRVELKNINSPRYLAAAVDDEMKRQVRLIESGGVVVMETRLWDADKKESRTMRTKEEAHDYRYFRDPDLPPLVISQDEIARVRAALPELPGARRQRYEALGLKPADAALLASEAAALFDGAVALAPPGSEKALANWVVNEVLALDEAQQGWVAPAALAGLVKLIDDGVITGKIGKDVLAEIAAGRGADPAAIVELRGWRAVRDTGAVAAALEAAIAQSPKEWAQLQAGKTKIMGFFVGQVMKATGGKADPAEVNALIAARLAGSGGG